MLYSLCNAFFASAQWILFKKIPENPKTILVFRVGHLGDTLCAVPSLTALKEKYPDSRFILMTNQTHGKLPFPKEVFQGILEFDQVIAYEPSRIKEAKYVSWLIGSLRRLNIDLIVYLSQSIASIARVTRDMFFFKMAGCKAACGFRISILQIFPVAQRYFKKFDQESLRLIKLLSPLGIKPEIRWTLPRVDFSLKLDEEFSKYPIIAIHPSAKIPVKKWPIERFAAVAQYLQKNHKAYIVIVGGADAEPEAAILTKALDKTRLLDLTGSTSYLETAEVLRRCVFLLSNDSGPVHLAAAVGIPVVGIYSARDFPNFWYPWGNGHQIFRKDVDCQICYLETCPVMTCILNITVEEVISACERLLKNHAENGEILERAEI